MRNIKTLLNDNWLVAERIPAGRDLLFMQGGERDWIPAHVPGHVHCDLVKAGVIGDPFYRMQERSCQWVDEADWTYRRTFTVDAERLAARGEYGRHFLEFHGLDTLARVYLNGDLVGLAQNMYVPHRFDVTEALREGENELRVEFDSALRVGRERAAAYLGDGTSERGAQSYFNFGPRAFVRKAQYMFGWDWGPELISCGIWQGVELVTVPVAEIRDWRLDYTLSDDDHVSATFTVTIERYAEAPLDIVAAVFAPGDSVMQVSVPDGPGRHVVTVALNPFIVQRWRPNGSADHSKRYLLNLRLLPANRWADREPIHLVTASIGFRTVELIREPDPDGQGEGMLFRVNGADTFAKGANWIPDHSFPGTITRARLRERLTQARDAGYNMLRIWGGGLYETETFYEICDELGILVWQDFPFACSMYPDDEEWFVDQVRDEARLAVRRIRNHPSLALWCGGNENLELAQDRWAGKTQAARFFGDRLIHEVLPAVLAEEDPRTPYLPNSPYGGEKATSEDHGDSHYWNVWHSKLPGSNGDWTNYALSRSRFSSEFGFAAPAGRYAWEGVLAPQDHTVRSAVSRWHDKTRKGYETYLGYIGMHFPEPRTWDDLLYYGQANQAEALKFGVEHWRRMKGRCWGTLIWQINDCWPTHSWAMIDSAGDPKLSYYASRRFYAPLLLSLTDSGTDIAAHLVNDTLREIPGRLSLRFLSFDGEEWAGVETESVAPANAASEAVATLSLPAEMRAKARDGFVHARFDGADGQRAENFLFLAEPRDLRLPDPCMDVDVRAEAGRVTLSVSSERFAGWVRLEIDGLEAPPQWSDNGFHLAPGQVRTITIKGLPGQWTAEDIRACLRCRHL